MTNLAKVTQINVAKVREAMETGTAQIIDVRPSFDFAGGRIPGSISLPNRSLTSRGDQLDKGRQLILVSEDGHQGEEVAQIAATLGFQEVANLHGGFEAWLDAEYPVHTIDEG
jgi:hydroxyacylglutathione hydrolase